MEHSFLRLADGLLIEHEDVPELNARGYQVWRDGKPSWLKVYPHDPVGVYAIRTRLFGFLLGLSIERKGRRHEPDPRTIMTNDGTPLVDPASCGWPEGPEFDKAREAFHSAELDAFIVGGPIDPDPTTWAEIPVGDDVLAVCHGAPVPSEFSACLSIIIGKVNSPMMLTVTLARHYRRSPTSAEDRAATLDEVAEALLRAICPRDEWIQMLDFHIESEQAMKAIRRRLANYLRHAVTEADLCAPLDGRESIEWHPEARLREKWAECQGVGCSLAAPKSLVSPAWDEDLPPESELPDDSDACDRFIEQARDAGLAAAYAWAKKTFIHGYSPRMLVAVAFTKARKQAA